MSRTLQQTINWASSFVNYLPLTVGANNEPAITNANNIKQLFLSVDVMSTPQNRYTVSFPTVIGQQDYVLSTAGSPPLPSFGYLETATLTLASTGKIFQIKDVYNTEPLGESADQQRPNAISVQSDDGNGNIKFRFMGVPDAVYTCTLNYQMAATQFASLTDTWSPIPDRYAYIYNRGFLGETLEPVDAQRAQMEKQRFIMSLASIAEGMSLADKAIFIAQYLSIDAQTAANMLDVQQGNQAKGAR